MCSMPCCSCWQFSVIGNEAMAVLEWTCFTEPQRKRWVKGWRALAQEDIKNRQQEDVSLGLLEKTLPPSWARETGDQGVFAGKWWVCEALPVSLSKWRRTVFPSLLFFINRCLGSPQSSWPSWHYLFRETLLKSLREELWQSLLRRTPLLCRQIHRSTNLETQVSHVKMHSLQVNMQDWVKLGKWYFHIIDCCSRSGSLCVASQDSGFSDDTQILLTRLHGTVVIRMQSCNCLI